MVESVIQIKKGIKINVDAGVKIKKKSCVPKKIIFGYIWSSATCSCKNDKYLASDIEDSVITCDEIIDAVSKS